VLVAREVAELIEAEGCKAVLLSGDITDKAFCEILVGKVGRGSDRQLAVCLPGRKLGALPHR
jgi:hypothetical protein